MLLPGPIIMLLQRCAETVQQPNQSKCQRARDDVTAIRAALDSYAMQHAGQYPESLAELVAPDASGFPYMNSTSVLRDPWDHQYVYARGPLRLLSYGRDGAPGGTGEDADIESVFATWR